MSGPFVPTWRDIALCRQIPGDLWFPEKGDSAKAAKQVCAACPVRQACLDYAMRHDERFGIYGGLTERERKALRRQARPPATVTSLPMPVVATEQHREAA